MSSLPTSMEEEPQCVLQLFLLDATWLKNKIKRFAIKCENRTCRRERVKLESRNKVLIEIKGESRIGQREKTEFEITVRIAKKWFESKGGRKSNRDWSY